MFHYKFWDYNIKLLIILIITINNSSYLYKISPSGSPTLTFFFLMWLIHKFFFSKFLFHLDLNPFVKSLQFSIYLLRVSSVQSYELSTIKSLNPIVKSYFAYINESISKGKKTTIAFQLVSITSIFPPLIPPENYSQMNCKIKI